MVAALDVRLTFGDLVGRDPRRRKHLGQICSGQLLDRARVGDLMYAAADDFLGRLEKYCHKGGMPFRLSPRAAGVENQAHSTPLPHPPKVSYLQEKGA